MEIVDKKKLDTAILYLQRIADGKNPVNNMPAEDDTVLNNPNVIRCMYFVKEVLEDYDYQKLTYKPILQWLKDNGFLVQEFRQEFNKPVTLPTEKGSQIGIRAEKRNSLQGVAYMSIIYNKQAQEYIVQNMEAILKGEELCGGHLEAGASKEHGGGAVED